MWIRNNSCFILEVSLIRTEYSFTDSASYFGKMRKKKEFDSELALFTSCEMNFDQ